MFFFIDGLGLGDDEDYNPARQLFDGITGFPFVASSAPGEFSRGVLISADATGGVRGLPQSATGQTTLITGVNAAARLGYHLTALPNRILVELIRERGIMRLLADGGITVTASNLYTHEFFAQRERMEKQRGKNSLPVSALTIRSSGTPFRYPEDYARGRAIFTDLTNRFLQDRGYDIPLITASEAAQRMVAILDDADFVFHEYFATDSYAHKKQTEDLDRALKEIDHFFHTLLNLVNLKETAILAVSDHGNCEDSRSSNHNRNPVPVLLFSQNETARAKFRDITSLEDVQAGILAYFGLGDQREPPAETANEPRG